MKRPPKFIQDVRKAQVAGDFRLIGRLINQATGHGRGILIGMLACEVALRKRKYVQALQLLQYARRYFVDEYPCLQAARRQEIAIKRFRDEPEFAELVVERRAHAVNSGDL